MPDEPQQVGYVYDPIDEQGDYYSVRDDIASFSEFQLAWSKFRYAFAIQFIVPVCRGFENLFRGIAEVTTDVSESWGSMADGVEHEGKPKRGE